MRGTGAWHGLRPRGETVLLTVACHRCHAGGQKGSARTEGIGGGGAHGKGKSTQKAAGEKDSDGQKKQKQQKKPPSREQASGTVRALRERTSQPDYLSQIELPNLAALTEEGWGEEALMEEALLEARERRREAERKKLKRQKLQR